MKLVEQLRVDFPEVLFVVGDECRWTPEKNAVFYTDEDEINLLHELGHALLGHKNFTQDIELLHFERDAWEKAREIGVKYGVKITDQQIENALDTYRDWLHERSKCPNCGQNGVQSGPNGDYRCINCNTVWKTNDARKTALRRYKRK